MDSFPQQLTGDKNNPMARLNFFLTMNKRPDRIGFVIVQKSLLTFVRDCTRNVLTYVETARGETSSRRRNGYARRIVPRLGGSIRLGDDVLSVCAASPRSPPPPSHYRLGFIPVINDCDYNNIQTTFRVRALFRTDRTKK